ncbi:4Fe-4S binding protein [Acetonema longum]|uniref:4Fe-4S ferredoxin iron-sulfur binding domain-containing protein n=1 Tax=Acetonema longum DSM 6540 TaxID=1009370 RepID=F7NG51_9FIRM|nr:4Fe-4S binding protein [Acetonema longum]EGO64969.1 4Fe-4S ferredoxin iron-sulfur binding domain-containing protein [Acetonema longum DSM 6540]
MQQAIREFVLNLGVDDVGFARAGDYQNPKSYEIRQFLPEAESFIVLAFKVLSSCESPSWSVALNGYMDLGAYAREASYKTARFLENRFNAKVATVPLSYPFEVRHDRRGIADFSQRHAAIAAGLGTFGRHNLVVHPRFGTRVNFVSIITDLELEPSPKIEQDLCIHCNLCVNNCPVKALEQEGKTNVAKCLKNALPYSLGTDIAFWTEFGAASPEEQKELLRSERYGRLHQAAHIGNQYMCFNCVKSCPVGVTAGQ